METPPNPAPFQRIEPGQFRQPPESPWKKLLGPLGAIALLVVKFGAKLKFLILPVLKFLPVILKTGGSMFITIAIYAGLWGWKWAVGFVLLIFVHELGHVFAARQFGVKASAPMFIPFMGAFIALKDAPKTAYAEAEIGIAGPLWGAAASAVCHAIGLAMDWPLFVALAWSGYWLNLFNLIPIGQMDGGHVAQALSRWLWIPGFAIMGYLAWNRPGNFIMWLMLFSALPRLISLFRKHTEEEARFYDITPQQRWKTAFTYFGLIIALAFQMHTCDVYLASHRARAESSSR